MLAHQGNFKRLTRGSLASHSGYILKKMNRQERKYYVNMLTFLTHSRCIDLLRVRPASRVYLCVRAGPIYQRLFCFYAHSSATTAYSDVLNVAVLAIWNPLTWPSGIPGKVASASSSSSSSSSWSVAAIYGFRGKFPSTWWQKELEGHVLSVVWLYAFTLWNYIHPERHQQIFPTLSTQQVWQWRKSE